LLVRLITERNLAFALRPPGEVRREPEDDDIHEENRVPCLRDVQDREVFGTTATAPGGGGVTVASNDKWPEVGRCTMVTGGGGGGVTMAI
jgi:hypothetical protein